MQYVGSTSWNWYEDLQIHIVISADVILNSSWLLERTSSLSYSDYYGTIIVKVQLKGRWSDFKEYTKRTNLWPVSHRFNRNWDSKANLISKLLQSACKLSKYEFHCFSG